MSWWGMKEEEDKEGGGRQREGAARVRETHLCHRCDHHTTDDGEEGEHLHDGGDSPVDDDTHEDRAEGLCRLDDICECDGTRTQRDHGGKVARAVEGRQSGDASN